MRVIRRGLTLVGCTLALAAAATAQQGAATKAAPDPVQLLLDSLRLDANGVSLSPADVAGGARTIAAKEHVVGNVASWHGPLEIHGTVDGNAVAIGGDVLVGKGGRVRGDAVAVGGTVRLDGGTVDGETRTISAITVGPARRRALSPAQAMGHGFSLSVGWYLVLACIGFGVLLVARAPLDAVSDTVREQTVRAFTVGVLGELGVAPVFALGATALAITIIGVIVIPFAAVAYFAAVAGALALGFLAVVSIAGQTMTGGRNGDRSVFAALQPLLLGLSIFLLLWVAGTGFGWTGGLGTALRITGALITWAAVTTGFGAVILTRAGTRPSAPPSQLAPAPTAEHEWQTPTPVTGVAAARRPTPAPRKGMTE